MYKVVEKILVIKLTGKIFDEEKLLKKYIELFDKLVEKYRLVLIAGGGLLARKYIEKARKIGIDSNYWLDIIGIIASRLNSYLLISGLEKHTYPNPITSLEELLEKIRLARIVVAGGLIPNQSTASVALEFAEALDVKEIIDVSAVDHVYDKDPRRYSNAKKYTEIKASELIEILKQKNLPGEYALIDIRALEIAIRSKIKIYLTFFKEPENIFKILRGENPGTIIYPE